MPSSFIRSTASAICSTMTGARPSEGSSSSTARGLPIRVRAMVSICCSPPDMAEARRPFISARFGKIENSRSGVQGARPSRPAPAPDLQVLEHGQVGEDAPVLRHVAEAEPRDAEGLASR